jgi:hypothetical protein
MRVEFVTQFSKLLFVTTDVLNIFLLLGVRPSCHQVSRAVDDERAHRPVRIIQELRGSLLLPRQHCQLQPGS